MVALVPDERGWHHSSSIVTIADRKPSNNWKTGQKGIPTEWIYVQFFCSCIKTGLKWKDVYKPNLT